MSDKKRKNQQPESSSGSGPGKSAKPDSTPESSSRNPDEPVREIPLGTPMDPAEFRRRKEEAKKPDREHDVEECDCPQDEKRTP
ncbi:MAG: hypothetical protein WD401_02450 [Thermomicrobiaceae bacterium]